MTVQSPTGLRARATTPPSGGGFLGACAAEWVKLRSVRSTWWTVLGAFLLMIVFAPGIAGSVANSSRDSGEVVPIPIGEAATLAVNVVQFAIAALAMIVITSEYSTGSIHSTLQWVPRRRRMLLAKTTVVGLFTLVFGWILGAVGTLAGWPLLFELAEVNPSRAASTVFFVGIYLALAAVFTIGVGTVLRSAAGTLTIAIMLLAVIPGALQLSSLDAVRRLADAFPSTAGLHMMNLSTEPYPPLVGLLIVAAWAAASLGVGLVVLNKRDA